MRLFCFGLGYTALALARVLAAEGWQVAGTTRDPDKQARLEREGIERRGKWLIGISVREPGVAAPDLDTERWPKC